MTPTIYTIPFLLLIIFWCSSADDVVQDFVECLKQDMHPSDVVYTKTNSSYTSILQFSIQNLRFASDTTAKPLVIITPNYDYQIPPVINCARKKAMRITIRSGGHDYEGLSYVSGVPFVMIDMINLSDVKVNVEKKTAWVDAGATLGILYYRIAEKSPVLGFPGGLCPTVGVSGLFSGGGYGTLLRKYGMAADQVIDARIIDADGRILDRESMGEDLFWAIRGGGGGAFGVVTAWKVRLVDVPEMVTVFTIHETREQKAIELIDRWQYIAPRLSKDLFIRFRITKVNTTVRASFNSMFLGGMDTLLSVMHESFPELGLVKRDLTEMTWARSILYFNNLPIETLQVLLNRTDPRVPYFKAKSDFVQIPFPRFALRDIWKKYDDPEAKVSTLSFVPYGGRMDEISSSATPFPYRAGYLYHIQHLLRWYSVDAPNTDKYIEWSTKLYKDMAPYVSKQPRAAYINFRDLDLGVNEDTGRVTYAKASSWGIKYFNQNFDRLIAVKNRVDPHNFFRNAQSIPPFNKTRYLASY